MTHGHGIFRPDTAYTWRLKRFPEDFPGWDTHKNAYMADVWTAVSVTHIAGVSSGEIAGALIGAMGVPDMHASNRTARMKAHAPLLRQSTLRQSTRRTAWAGGGGGLLDEIIKFMCCNAATAANATATATVHHNPMFVQVVPVPPRDRYTPLPGGFGVPHAEADRRLAAFESDPRDQPYPPQFQYQRPQPHQTQAVPDVQQRRQDVQQRQNDRLRETLLQRAANAQRAATLGQLSHAGLAAQTAFVAGTLRDHTMLGSGSYACAYRVGEFAVKVVGMFRITAAKQLADVERRIDALKDVDRQRKCFVYPVTRPISLQTLPPPARSCAGLDAPVCVYTSQLGQPVNESALRKGDLRLTLHMYHNLATGLAKLHAKGWYHMDLKIQNAVYHHGTLKLIDLDTMWTSGEPYSFTVRSPEMHEHRRDLTVYLVTLGVCRLMLDNRESYKECLTYGRTMAALDLTKLDTYALGIMLMRTVPPVFVASADGSALLAPMLHTDPAKRCNMAQVVAALAKAYADLGSK